MATSADFKLHGQFLECCDCFTICPCWVNDRPDEDHCSAIYVWTLGADCVIDRQPVPEGTSVVAASFHGNRSGTQSAILVDERLTPALQRLLIDAFSGRTVQRLQDLQRLVGTIVHAGPARIDVTRNGKRWEVSVSAEGSQLARAHGGPATMEGRQKPLTLQDTALHDELGLSAAVEVHRVERFELAVSALPGGPFVYAGRSGMAAPFAY